MSDCKPINWRNGPSVIDKCWPECSVPELQYWRLHDDAGKEIAEIACPIPSEIDCWLATDLHEFAISILRATECRFSGESKLRRESETLNESLIFFFPSSLPPCVEAALDLFDVSDRKLARYDSTGGLNVRKELPWDSPLLKLTLEDAYLYGRLNESLSRSEAVTEGYRKIEKDKAFANLNRKHRDKAEILKALREARLRFSGKRIKTRTIEGAAEILRISGTALRKKIRKLQIEDSGWLD